MSVVLMGATRSVKAKSPKSQKRESVKSGWCVQVSVDHSNRWENTRTVERRDSDASCFRFPPWKAAADTCELIEVGDRLLAAEVTLVTDVMGWAVDVAFEDNVAVVDAAVDELVDSATRIPADSTSSDKEPSAFWYVRPSSMALASDMNFQPLDLIRG